MRRNKQALCQEECEQVLCRATSGVLSLISLDGFPYGVPLSYALVDGVIVFHGALEGQKSTASTAITARPSAWLTRTT